MSLQNDLHPHATLTDALPSVLTNQHCRFVVRFFGAATEDSASVDALSAAFAREHGGGEDQAALHLHHTALPKLSDVGIVDYDARSETVRYHDHSESEDLLRIIDSAPEGAAKVE